jgi:hypothetical protein
MRRRFFYYTSNRPPAPTSVSENFAKPATGGTVAQWGRPLQSRAFLRYSTAPFPARRVRTRPQPHGRAEEAGKSFDSFAYGKGSNRHRKKRAAKNSPCILHAGAVQYHILS